jgi:hypothetical protein
MECRNRMDDGGFIDGYKQRILREINIQLKLLVQVRF